MKNFIERRLQFFERRSNITAELFLQKEKRRHSTVKIDKL